MTKNKLGKCEEMEYEDILLNTENISALFEKYNFNPYYFKDKPEVILLAMSLFLYLEYYEKEEERNASTVVFLLGQMREKFVEGKGWRCSNLDMLFEEASAKANELKNYLCLDCYSLFKETNSISHQDAVLSLYEWYVCGQYIN